MSALITTGMVLGQRKQNLSPVNIKTAYQKYVQAYLWVQVCTYPPNFYTPKNEGKLIR